MDNLIQAIEALEPTAFDEPRGVVTVARSDVIELIESMLAGKVKEREWISVEKDGLPDEDGNYIIFANDIVIEWTEVRRLKTHHYKRFLDDDGFSDYPPIVTHWMKLPEAPQ